MKNKSLVLLGVLSFFFLLVLFYIVFDINLMEKMGVNVMTPMFADLLVVTAALDCARMGFDPLVENPCDPWGVALNYPRIWLVLGALGLGLKHSFYLGIILAGLFYSSVFLAMPRLNRFGSFFYLGLLLSPAVLLAVERGNNDLVIFILIAICLKFFYKRQRLFYPTLFFAAVLKLFPIFSLSVCLKEKKKTSLLIAGCSLAVFFAYCFFIRGDLRLILKVTIENTLLFMTYGSAIIFQGFLDIALARGLGPFPQWLSAQRLGFGIATFFGIMTVLVALKNKMDVDQGSRVLAGFRVGAGIFVGSFVLMINWEYRLIFLIFAVPQLLQWAQKSNVLKLWARSVLFSMIFLCWSGLLYRVDYYYLDNQFGFSIWLIYNVLSWVLFLSLIYLFGRTLPGWFAMNNFNYKKS